MDFLPFGLVNHPAPKKIQLDGFEAYLGEAIDTPLGTMTGIQIQLPKDMPNIILFPKHESVLYSSGNYQISNGQSLNLEGDFNKYFDAYSVPGYEVFALEVLTPDFMQALMELGSGMVVMLALNKAFVMLQVPQKLNPRVTEKLTTTAQSLALNLAQKLRTWSDKDAEESSKRMLDSSLGSSATVRLKGRPLNGVLYAFLVIAAIFLAFIWLTFISSPSFQKRTALPGDLKFSAVIIALAFSAVVINYLVARKK
jgi:hypothetical protein